MIWNFDESVISVLPEGDVPYQPVEGDVQASKEQGFLREQLSVMPQAVLPLCEGWRRPT